MYTLIRDPDQVKNCLDSINKDKLVFCDTETCYLEGHTDGGLYGDIRLIQVYQTGWKEAMLFDCFFIDLDDILIELHSCHTVWHNASYDLHTINRHTPDLWLPKNMDDTVYMARLCLNKITNRYSFYDCLKATKLADDVIRDMNKKENQKADWGNKLTPTMLKYAACDVLYLSLLHGKVYHAKQFECYDLDIFNLKYAIEYSRRGIPVSQNKIKERFRTSLMDYEEISSKLPVNPNSAKQVCEYLGLDKSDMDTLVKAKLEGDERAGWVRDARQISKTITFLKKYNRPTIYGFYNPCGAVTGRFSCTGGDRYDSANLQQIPRRILDCLQAPAGRTFVYSDYSGLELRMAVCWVGEPTMHRLIMDGTDVHEHTGSVIYQKPMEDLSKYERMIGKTCNFLLIYGGSVYTLQSTIRSWGGVLLSLSECKTILDAWFSEYSYFKAWQDITKRALNVYGYMDVSTALGREVRAYKINDALNIPVQGSSSEVTKKSLQYLKERYPDENLVSTIHDSNTLLPTVDTADMWKDRLDECMIDAWNYVIKDLAIPDLPMPPGAQISNVWEFD